MRDPLESAAANGTEAALGPSHGDAGTDLDVVGDTEQLADLGGALPMQCGEGRAQTDSSGCEEEVLHRRVDGGVVAGVVGWVLLGWDSAAQEYQHVDGRVAEVRSEVLCCCYSPTSGSVELAARCGVAG